MGTNYYAVEKSYRYGRNVIHLGKSSLGWMFLFHSCEEFRTFSQFKRWLTENIDGGKYLIFNEYGDEVGKDELLTLIDSKQNDPKDSNNPENFDYDVMDIDGYRFRGGEFG